MKPLPPFSGDDTCCPKCSEASAATAWTPEYAIGIVALYPEHLLRTCGRCGYQWREALNPPTHDKPAVAEIRELERKLGDPTLTEAEFNRIRERLHHARTAPQESR